MVRLAVAQVNPTVGAFQGNFAKLKAAIREAKRAKAHVVFFPEMVTTGYPPNDLLERHEFWQENEALLVALAPLSTGIVIVVGTIFPLSDNDRPRGGGIPLGHGALVFKNGAQVATQAKTHLPNVDVFNETRYFSRAQSYSLISIAPRLTAALAICEDIWNVPQPDRPYGPYTLYAGDSLKRLAAQHPSLFIAINASPYWRGKFEARLARVRQIVARTERPFLYVNAVGANDELIFDGRSFAVNARGDCVWQMAGFKEDVALLDWKTLLAPKVSVAMSMPSQEEEVTHAIALGIRDYVHKSGFKKVVLGLSGGIDSALTAALAVRALGKDAVLGVWLPSPYSSVQSEQDGYYSARALGIDCRSIPITPFMEKGHEALQPWKEATAAWAMADENIQARLRALLMMAIANGEERLLLSTSNKSELAVGYSTLYGDMCGALAPIGDLYKTEVYALARALNETQPLFSQSILAKPPSAELRPNQCDQDSLPAYEILDRLIMAYMEARKSPAELVEMGFDAEMVRWFVTVFHQNEYKRKQAGPILKLRPRSFGIGWRYPLVKRTSI